MSLGSPKKFVIVTHERKPVYEIDTSHKISWTTFDQGNPSRKLRKQICERTPEFNTLRDLLRSRKVKQINLTQLKKFLFRTFPALIQNWVGDHQQQKKQPFSAKKINCVSSNDRKAKKSRPNTEKPGTHAPHTSMTAKFRGSRGHLF